MLNLKILKSKAAKSQFGHVLPSLSFIFGTFVCHVRKRDIVQVWVPRKCPALPKVVTPRSSPHCKLYFPYQLYVSLIYASLSLSSASACASASLIYISNCFYLFLSIHLSLHLNPLLFTSAHSFLQMNNIMFPYLHTYLRMHFYLSPAYIFLFSIDLPMGPGWARCLSICPRTGLSLYISVDLPNYFLSAYMHDMHASLPIISSLHNDFSIGRSKDPTACGCL